MLDKINNILNKLSNPQLVELHLEYWLCTVREELPPEQSGCRNRSSRGMALHTAITMVDRHNMAVGGGAVSAVSDWMAVILNRTSHRL